MSIASKAWFIIESMSVHNMKLQQKYFDFIKAGTKRIELRLYDEKRQRLKLGDLIEFGSPNGEKIAGEIIGLIRYRSFRDLMVDFDVSILADGSVSKQDLLDDLEVFYTPEEQARLGVLGIRIKLLSELKTSDYNA